MSIPSSQPKNPVIDKIYPHLQTPPPQREVRKKQREVKRNTVNQER